MIQFKWGKTSTNFDGKTQITMTLEKQTIYKFIRILK